MNVLPDGAVHYKSTPEFTQDTIPAALLRDHATAAGVWGRIRIIEGNLLYREDGQERLLTPFAPRIVAPQVRHEVALAGPVRFCVDFFRLP
jgi:tellurite resistance-related uncharacterized protein